MFSIDGSFARPVKLQIDQKNKVLAWWRCLLGSFYLPELCTLILGMVLNYFLVSGRPFFLVVELYFIDLILFDTFGFLS